VHVLERLRDEDTTEIIEKAIRRTVPNHNEILAVSSPVVACPPEGIALFSTRRNLPIPRPNP
jgi:hypothetical protein